jgi:hypothetical protein
MYRQFQKDLFIHAITVLKRPVVEAAKLIGVSRSRAFVWRDQYRIPKRSWQRKTKDEKVLIDN